MRITAAGWARDCGANEIAEINLNEVRAIEGKFTYGPGKPAVSINHSLVRKDRVNSVTVNFFANVRLGGDYGFKVKLSKSEIARLFYLTHKNEVSAFRGLFPNEPEGDSDQVEAA